MKLMILRAITASLGLFSGIAGAAPSFDEQLAHIQQQWAIANYQITASKDKVQAFDDLAKEAHSFSVENPNRAEPLIWEGIVLSTYAGVKGGLGALGLAKKSRAALEAAMKIDDKALDGSAYTSLGVLYAKVPGFPLGFGDDGKAEELFARAIALNPYGVDPNFFYAQYLCDHKECRDAKRYLDRALKAPPRPGRELADEGRHREVMELMAKAH